MGDFASNRIKKLVDSGFIAEQPLQHRSTVSLSEKGKTYKVDVRNGAKSVVFQIDGYVITAGLKCDKFLAATTNTDSRAVFVELKGKDISHAIDQLEATINNHYFLPHPLRNDCTRARIVSSGCGPKSASHAKLEKARIRFKEHYNIELKILKNNQPDSPVSF